MLLLLLLLRSDESIHHGWRTLILAVNLFLVAGDDRVFDLGELLLLLLVLLILLGEFLHEIRDDDGRRSGATNEAMNEDLALLVVVVDGFINERECIIERTLDILADGVAEIDLHCLDAVARKNGVGEVTFVGDVEDVEDTTGDEFGSIHRVHGRPEVDARMNERSVEVVVVALLLFQLTVSCNRSKLKVVV